MQLPVGQAKLIEAAISIPTVEWFFPSEFSWDFETIGLGSCLAQWEDPKILQKKQLDDASKLRNFSYTIVCPGLFHQFYFTDYCGFFLKEKKLVVPGTGNTTASLTTLENIAKMVEYIVSRGLTEDVRNKTIYLADETVSYYELKERLEKYFNCEWVLEEVPLDEVERRTNKLKEDKDSSYKAFIDWAMSACSVLLGKQVGVKWTEDMLWNRKYFNQTRTTIEEFLSAKKIEINK